MTVGKDRQKFTLDKCVMVNIPGTSILVHERDVDGPSSGIISVYPDQCNFCGKFKLGPFIIRRSCYATGGNLCNVTFDKVGK